MGWKENDLWHEKHTRGQMRHWHTLDPAIPRQVASPQSLTPLHQAGRL